MLILLLNNKKNIEIIILEFNVFIDLLKTKRE